MKKCCNAYDRFTNMPYHDKVIDDGEVVVASIFQFKRGCEELFSFLYGCSERNCDVTFENENIHIRSDDLSIEQKMTLAIYATLAQDSEIFGKYANYLVKAHSGEIDIDKPNITVKGQHEPILRCL